MKRGEIYFADLDPTIGAEIQKRRPVLIISNDANNRVSKTVTIIPITSNVKKIYPFEVLIEMKASGLSKSSKAQCQQIRTISKVRIQGRRIGALNNIIMTKINSATKLHLDML